MYKPTRDEYEQCIEIVKALFYDVKDISSYDIKGFDEDILKHHILLVEVMAKI